jgi:FAD/FMN-containing dehydrogenase/Fe-S oxidoreductase
MPQLDPERERIQDDLRGLIAGEVRCDDVFLQLYASDASIYEIKPLGIVRPRSAADVVATAQYAAEKQIPLHARGAGSGVAGESLGQGLAVDFSRYMRRVLHTDLDRVRVQPGMVHERLNAHLLHWNRMFGPDPAASSITTMGSVLAIDGAGSHSLRYGSARRHVLRLQVVLADGTLMEVGREPTDPRRSDCQRKKQIVEQLTQLLSTHAPLIKEKQPRTAVSRGGYNLTDVLTDGHLDLAKLLVGSEGTLALFTEVQLAIQPVPRHRGVLILLFDSLEKAARSVQHILPHDPAACDLMDRRHLSLAREADSRYEQLIPDTAEAALLVEQDGDEPFAVRDRLLKVLDEVRSAHQLAFGARQAFDPVEVDFFWKLARKVQPVLYRLKSNARPVPVVEDVSVGPVVLPEFLVRLQNVLKRHQVVASLFCHAGLGQLHVQPFLDLTDPADVEKMQRLAEDYYEEVFAAGGTLGGEHACGLSRSTFLRRQYGDLYEVFREVKRIFDPQNLLNPGKIITDEPGPIGDNLRHLVQPPKQGEPRDSSEPQLRNLIELQLNWDPNQVAAVARACNGCGHCRSQMSGGRMCPIFRIAPSEEASPRAKANLIRGVLTGQLDLESLTSEEFKAVADLCVHCHMCVLECPARVDIPKLMLEGKGAYVAANGLGLSDRTMTHLHALSGLGSRFHLFANWAIANRQMRWLMEKTIGLAQGRKLPPFASRSFLRRAARRRLTKPIRRTGNKVAYFVDTYANFHDTQLAEAAVAVLEHNGVSVYVPPDQREAGMAAIACGALDRVRKLARHNLAIFADAVRQGYHIVATEPAVVICLTREYPSVLDNDDARLVAQNSSDVSTYLWRMHMTGNLQLDLRPINATLNYHMPCRMKALDVGSPSERLLGLVPGLTVQHHEEGCSGMCGAWGMKRENYRASLRAGWPLINRLRDPDLTAGTTECCTCKMQMEQGTTKPTIHPVKLLALSYGLMPEAGALLNATSGELTVT